MTNELAHFRRRDRAEIVVGACIMRFPAAVTGEVWDLAEGLPLGHVLLFAVASFAFLAFTIYVLHGHEDTSSSRRDFVIRVFNTYGITLLVCALMLFGLGQFDLLNEPIIGIKRTIIVSFPASFAATAVDSFGRANSNN